VELRNFHIDRILRPVSFKAGCPAVPFACYIGQAGADIGAGGGYLSDFKKRAYFQLDQRLVFVGRGDIYRGLFFKPAPFQKLQVNMMQLKISDLDKNFSLKYFYI